MGTTKAAHLPIHTPTIIVHLHSHTHTHTHTNTYTHTHTHTHTHSHSLTFQIHTHTHHPHTPPTHTNSFIINVDFPWRFIGVAHNSNIGQLILITALGTTWRVNAALKFTWSSTPGDEVPLLDQAPDDAESVVEGAVRLFDHQLVGPADDDWNGGALTKRRTVVNP